MGGDKRCYLILIENLDKDLTSSAIVEFILHCRTNLEKLCGLLDSHDCVVVSKGGRPCVVTGKFSQYDPTAGPILASMLKYQENSLHRNLKIDDGLKIFYSGSKEYNTAMQLKGIILELVSIKTDWTRD